MLSKCLVARLPSLATYGEEEDKQGYSVMNCLTKEEKLLSSQEVKSHSQETLLEVYRENVQLMNVGTWDTQAKEVQL
ncbi:hypothetical protein QV09_05180 [Gallibacterium salpingitidis]|uniref:Uncharacterized protein n=1 Tax=Gallibacterium salpingitidis TaxID=505341 RepID=A0AB36E2S4_9PAST|nr:hypothetical protein QV09_05180 [Gallibacterium salpingitidis]